MNVREVKVAEHLSLHFDAFETCRSISERQIQTAPLPTFGVLRKSRRWPNRIGGMKVSKKTANIMNIAGCCLGALSVFGLQYEYPRIANRLGNPAWLGPVLTGLILFGGALAALTLFRKSNSN